MALVRTCDAFLAVLNKALSHHGLSQAGREALAVLDGAGHPLSPTAIAGSLLITTASVTSLLDTLERRDLVKRLADPADRRKLQITLTPKGHKVIDQMLPPVVALQTALMSGLSETERRRLLSSLATIHHAIDTIDANSVVAAAPPRGVARHN